MERFGKQDLLQGRITVLAVGEVPLWTRLRYGLFGSAEDVFEAQLFLEQLEDVEKNMDRFAVAVVEILAVLFEKCLLELVQLHCSKFSAIHDPDELYQLPESFALDLCLVKLFNDASKSLQKRDQPNNH